MDYLEFETEIGWIILTEEDGKLIRIDFKQERPKQMHPSPNFVLQQTKEQLIKYFKGELQQFTVPFQMEGTTFQKQVWQITAQIPYGETLTYGEVAKRMNNPKASRAVGQALHVNPLAIIVPCHRVVGANHKLVGYASGLSIKQHLLTLESQTLKHMTKETAVD